MKAFLSAATLILMVSISALAQTESSVSVVDPSGRAIGGARVTVLSSHGTEVQSLTTDSSGRVSISGLPRGSYAAEVLAPGFERTIAQILAPSPSPQLVRLEVASIRNEVTVTGQRGGVEDAESTIQFVTSIGRDQLTQRPLSTIAGALEGAPGVTVQQTTYSAASPILHGQTGYQTLLLMDGVRFNTSIFRSGPNQYIALMDPSTAGRIEVTLGPTSASYGSDSMGGTINVLSLPAQFSTAGREVHGEFNVLGASADLSGQKSGRVNIGTRRLAVLMGGSLSRHNDVRAGNGDDSHNVYRRYFGLNREQLQKVFGNRLQNTGFLQYSADATVAARLTPSQTVTFRYVRSDIQNGRSYRDTWGGANRMRSLFVPQDLNFAYLRYEKLRLGPLDSFSGTFSLNQQNDGSILKGALVTDTETTDRSRVNAWGYAPHATTHIGTRQAISFGAEIYAERIYSTRFNLNPVANTNVQDRALYPNNSHYTTSGLYLQDSIALLDNLRVSGGVRYTNVRYITKAADNLDATGRSLGIIDSKRTFDDLTFNAGVQWNIVEAFGVDFSVSRGFRAPNVNDLGAVGAKTLGFDVTGEDAIAVGALLGADATDTPLPTGRKIEPLESETLFNYQTGFRLQTSRLNFRSQFFDAELAKPISGRSLLFPVDQVPATIGGVLVTPIAQSAAQKTAGVVSVMTSLLPRSVKTAINDGKTRYFGTDNRLRYIIDSRWSVTAGYSFMGGLDLNPIRPTRRLPPQEGSFGVRFAPGSRKPWIETTVRFAGAQKRFSPADIDDDRMGGSRRRSDIATFFRSYSASPNIAPGSDGVLGTADDLFTPTSETLRQIQDRVLPLNTVVNGVLVSADSVRVPVFTKAPGWTSINVRAGYLMTENINLTMGINNLLDRNYRSIGSGLDAAGINVFGGVRYAF